MEREYSATLKDQMSDLAARALETLRSLLDAPDTPPAIRLKAALAILQRPRFPEPGWALPERIELAKPKWMAMPCASTKQSKSTRRQPHNSLLRQSHAARSALVGPDRSTNDAVAGPLRLRPRPLPHPTARPHARHSLLAAPQPKHLAHYRSPALQRNP